MRERSSASAAGSSWPDTRRRRSSRLGGAWVTPGLIDCHTHLVFGGNRAAEWEARLAGASYEEIARARRRHRLDRRGDRGAPSKTSWWRAAQPRLEAMMRERRDHGRGEIGLRARSRHREEDAARRASAGRERRCAIVRTFLGAHAVPPEFAGRREAYVDLVCDTMIPVIARERPGRRGRRLLRNHRLHARTRSSACSRPRREHGLPVKLHAEQLSRSGRRRARRAISARCRSIISNMSTMPASRPWRAPARSRCCCPAPSISARDAEAAGRAARRHERAHGGRHRLQSRHLAEPRRCWP